MKKKGENLNPYFQNHESKQNKSWFFELLTTYFHEKRILKFHCFIKSINSVLSQPEGTHYAYHITTCPSGSWFCSPNWTLLKRCGRGCQVCFHSPVHKETIVLGPSNSSPFGRQKILKSCSSSIGTFQVPKLIFLNQTKTRKI